MEKVNGVQEKQLDETSKNLQEDLNKICDDFVNVLVGLNEARKK